MSERFSGLLRCCSVHAKGYASNLDCTRPEVLTREKSKVDSMYCTSHHDFGILLCVKSNPEWSLSLLYNGVFGVCMTFCPSKIDEWGTSDIFYHQRSCITQAVNNLHSKKKICITNLASWKEKGFNWNFTRCKPTCADYTFLVKKHSILIICYPKILMHEGLTTPLACFLVAHLSFFFFSNCVSQNACLHGKLYSLPGKN